MKIVFDLSLKSYVNLEKERGFADLAQDRTSLVAAAIREDIYGRRDSREAKEAKFWHGDDKKIREAVSEERVHRWFQWIENELEGKRVQGEGNDRGPGPGPGLFQHR
ncbi:hypothetical protein KQX54_021793 [Cotesia glomerata]|uniref:Uncharacterized protein n=1 Tax=Cotesia glomerata TaxID=32391 RepID=A0AAV7J890_COTGL|nr:hypothetical protein KQX54_021793 [Cotesia glomerata]